MTIDNFGLIVFIIHVISHIIRAFCPFFATGVDDGHRPCRLVLASFERLNRPDARPNQPTDLWLQRCFNRCFVRNQFKSYTINATSATILTRITFVMG